MNLSSRSVLALDVIEGTVDVALCDLDMLPPVQDRHEPVSCLGCSQGLKSEPWQSVIARVSLSVDFRLCGMVLLASKDAKNNRESVLKNLPKISAAKLSAVLIDIADHAHMAFSCLRKSRLLLTIHIFYGAFQVGI